MGHFGALLNPVNGHYAANVQPVSVTYRVAYEYEWVNGPPQANPRPLAAPLPRPLGSPRPAWWAGGRSILAARSALPRSGRRSTLVSPNLIEGTFTHNNQRFFWRAERAR